MKPSCLQILPIASVSLSDWQALVHSSPVASWFQSPEAYSFYQELDNLHGNSGFQSFGCAVTESGRLTGLVVCYLQSDGLGIRRLASRRAIIQGGPLLAPDISEEALAALLGHTINKLCNQVIYIEMRNFNDYSRWQSVFEAAGFIFQPHYNYHVATSTTNYSKELLRNLREAQQEDIVVTDHPTDEQFAEFYKLLSHRYHAKIHKPLPPKSYFDRLRQQPHVLTCVALAPPAHDSSVIAGFIGPYSSTTLYDMYSCGLTDAPRRWHPSEVITDFAIRQAAELGCQRFDFMGAGAPDDGGYGVRDFKAKFGGTLVSHGRYRHLCHPLLYRLGEFVISHHLLI